jgi:hypothetical protein
MSDVCVKRKVDELTFEVICNRGSTGVTVSTMMTTPEASVVIKINAGPVKTRHIAPNKSCLTPANFKSQKSQVKKYM